MDINARCTPFVFVCECVCVCVSMCMHVDKRAGFHVISLYLVHVVCCSKIGSRCV